MTSFSPFAGIRYAGEHAELARVVAPPYDVIDDDQHAALEAVDAHNSVRLILPRDEQREGDRYERAAATIRRWMDEGVLVKDDTPCLYPYRMEFTDSHGVARHTRGVIGALGLPEDGDASVLPHERTLPKAKSDRLSLLRATRVNTDPIWGLTLGEGLTQLLDAAEPFAACTDTDGVRHELGVIVDPDAIAAISKIVGDAPLVLADGHHRFETALNYRNERRAAGHDDPGAEAIMALVVELVEDELCIEPIHRLVDLPRGMNVRRLLSDAFKITDAGPITHDGIDALEAQMRAKRGLGIVDEKGLALAVPVDEVRAMALSGEHPAVAATDAAVVEAMVVPRLPGATWHYRADAQTVAALVDKRAHSAAILCSPVSVADTRRASIDQVRMPQKTTFFWPKPRTGMVFRSLD